ncbi:uncharacterized protein LOC113360328 [Papaver somniferum]|uniref:uncharacterized protein LOC113360328 n=1 Tax=Papaver somniferum TaxID=3469 RepID=UPI000E6F507A|nr:uncharacterized protein LOC113360328 [Papaver somniferum]
MDVLHHDQGFNAHRPQIWRNCSRDLGHLKKLFQDNKGNRAATLERQFVNLKFVDCTSIDDYCDKLKSLSDRLRDLDFPMNDKRLVIQLVNGLPEEYNTVASFIQQAMPTFDSARSQLRTEEIRRSQQSCTSSPTALAATARPQIVVLSATALRLSQTRGSRSSSSTAAPPLLPTPPHLYQLYRAPHPAYNNHWTPQWATPPCPYPTAPPETAWQQPFGHSSNRGRGRGGQSRGRPSSIGRGQAYLTPSTEYLHPSDIAEAYSSMSLHSPDDALYGYRCHIASHRRLRYPKHCF